MNSVIKKNNVTSNQIRQIGNQKFVEKNYFEALEKYNEAMRHAELNSRELGLCYGNRSAAFLQVKQYTACLENIQLARDNNFPEENLAKLLRRRTECEILMEMTDGRMEETWNDFFKLSYKPNPNFPFLANCLNLKRHERGMLLATNRDLKAGDIIAITEPFFRIPIGTTSYRCNYCLADKFMNYIPCSGCVEVMFCNETCMKKALNEFHQFECGISDNPPVSNHCITPLRMIMKCVSLFDGSRKEMEKFLSQNERQLVTPFDFSLENPSSLSSERKLLLTQFCDHQQIGTKAGVLEESFSEIKPFLKRHPKLRKVVTYDVYKFLIDLARHGDMKFFKSIEGKILSAVNESPGPFTINYFGGAIDVCYNLFLYSCAPTVFLHPYNGKIVWIVTHPIKAGDWLTIAFENTNFYERSREDRRAQIDYVVCCCKCPACLGNWKPILSVAMTPIYVMRRSSEEAIVAFKEYCEQINKKSKPLVGKCDENLWSTISQFRWNLFSIGKATYWNKIEQFDFQSCANFKDFRHMFEGTGE